LRRASEKTALAPIKMRFFGLHHEMLKVLGGEKNKKNSMRGCVKRYWLRGWLWLR